MYCLHQMHVRLTAVDGADDGGGVGTTAAAAVVDGEGLFDFS